MPTAPDGGNGPIYLCERGNFSVCDPPVCLLGHDEPCHFSRTGHEPRPLWDTDPLLFSFVRAVGIPWTPVRRQVSELHSGRLGHFAAGRITGVVTVLALPPACGNSMWYIPARQGLSPPASEDDLTSTPRHRISTSACNSRRPTYLPRPRSSTAAGQPGACGSATTSRSSDRRLPGSGDPIVGATMPYQPTRGSSGCAAGACTANAPAPAPARTADHSRIGEPQ